MRTESLELRLRTFRLPSFLAHYAPLRDRHRVSRTTDQALPAAHPDRAPGPRGVSRGGDKLVHLRQSRRRQDPRDGSCSRRSGICACHESCSASIVSRSRPPAKENETDQDSRNEATRPELLIVVGRKK